MILAAASACTTAEDHPVPPVGFQSSASDDTIVEMPDVPDPAPVAAQPDTAPAPPQPAATAAVARSTAPPPAGANAPPAVADAAPAPNPAVASIRFTPVIGAPVEVVRPLSAQLAAATRAHGIAIRTATDTSTDNILRGYFSAFSNGKETTVVYVWDVLDNAGNRLERIQGQETVEGRSKGDPWTAVPAATMQVIADKTVASYVAWRASRSG
ncbi:MAG: hypothetical protein ACTHJ3_08060 [Pararhizobium sp.]